MGFISDDDDIGSVGQLRIQTAVCSLELLNQSKDKLVILSQQPLQVLAALGLRFSFSDQTAVGKGLIDLII